ncbi:uncharacterized protein CLUP02_10887 [Colletotrichum lupini]|uniref:Uncharacterized protein n=1 Tax=Colletotrichum lupini TaxID=145971 RepID=A0A9Q8SYE3_9PEZI|nr:uncharacterized protein CLUP02_10887 [Colletotrichum lupini]KAK1715678.1 hypothetical protein BDP67DRAFT_284334 [Colletotrichum lupini]UQC85390.1 hypothetical protein CLUP02_10887 [Colletotrichum lupini]
MRKGIHEGQEQADRAIQTTQFLSRILVDVPKSGFHPPPLQLRVHQSHFIRLRHSRLAAQVADRRDIGLGAEGGSTGSAPLPPLEVRCLGPWTSTTANGRLDVAHWKQGTTQHLLATSTQLAFTTRRRLGDRQTTRENRSTEKRTSAIEAKSITSRRGVNFHCNSIKRPSPINLATQEKYQQTLQCLPSPTTQEGDLLSFSYKCYSGVGFSSSPALLPGFNQLRLPQAPKHQTISLQTKWSWDQNRTSTCPSHINTPYTNHTRSLAISMPLPDC